MLLFLEKVEGPATEYVVEEVVGLACVASLSVMFVVSGVLGVWYPSLRVSSPSTVGGVVRPVTTLGVFLCCLGGVIGMTVSLYQS